jgi:hypothetical protein
LEGQKLGQKLGQKSQIIGQNYGSELGGSGLVDWKGLFMGKLVGLGEGKRAEFLSMEIFGVQVRRVEGVKLLPFLRMRGRRGEGGVEEGRREGGGGNEREECRQRVVGELENRFEGEGYEGDGFGGEGASFDDGLGLDELGGYDFWGGSD